jgi:hypothetical protein
VTLAGFQHVSTSWNHWFAGGVHGKLALVQRKSKLSPSLIERSGTRELIRFRTASQIEFPSSVGHELIYLRQLCWCS